MDALGRLLSTQEARVTLGYPCYDQLNLYTFFFLIAQTTIATYSIWTEDREIVTYFKFCLQKINLWWKKQSIAYNFTILKALEKTHLNS